MRRILLFCCVVVVAFGCEKNTPEKGMDYIQALDDTLISLSLKSKNELFRSHCTSIVELLGSRKDFTREDSVLIKATYMAFNDTLDLYSPKHESSYMDRQRYFIFSWISPGDNSLSFAWFKPPKNYNLQSAYPLYIQLRNSMGFIEYLTLPFLSEPFSNEAYEDGFLLTPWGRGEDMLDETDIRECISAFQSNHTIDESRKYITGQSSSGFSAWNIACGSANKWAGIGIHSGTIKNDEYFNRTFRALRDVPIIFLCGDKDTERLEEYQAMVQQLITEGNQQVKLSTFNGVDEYRQEDVVQIYQWLRNYRN